MEVMKILINKCVEGNKSNVFFYLDYPLETGINPNILGQKANKTTIEKIFKKF